MSKADQAQEAFLEVFKQRQEEGIDELYALDLIDGALDIPTEPTIPHRLGNAMLRLVGKETRPYRPNYSGQLYSTLTRLERLGIVESRQEEATLPSRRHRRVYRLLGQEPNEPSS